MKWIPIHKKRPPIGDVFLLAFEKDSLPRAAFATLLANGNLCIDKDIQGDFYEEYEFKELEIGSRIGIFKIYWTEFHFPEGI